MYWEVYTETECWSFGVMIYFMNNESVNVRKYAALLQIKAWS